MTRTWKYLLPALVGLLVASAAVAQGTGSLGMEPKRLCYRGRPACPLFLITEAGLATRVGGVGQQYYAAGEVGVMKNLAGLTALGVSVMAGSTFEYMGDARVALKGRGRYWLNEHHALDAGVGPMAGGSGGAGVTAHVAVNNRDVAAGFVQLDAMAHTGVDVFLGLRLAGPTAAYTSVGIGAIIGILALLWAR
jgi:hypothetical protein